MVNLAKYQSDIQQAKDSGSGKDLMPSGDYVVALVNSEEKANSKKTGHYIELTFEIQEGEHAGKKVIDRINHDNPNEKARDIAFATLRSLTRAIDRNPDEQPLSSTDELIGRRIVAKIENKEGAPMLDDSGNQKVDDNGNLAFFRDINVKKYQSLSAGKLNATGGGVSSQSSAPQANSGSFPFPKKQ
jgi:hypothetical protein